MPGLVGQRGLLVRNQLRCTPQTAWLHCQRKRYALQLRHTRQHTHQPRAQGRAVKRWALRAAQAERSEQALSPLQDFLVWLIANGGPFLRQSYHQALNSTASEGRAAEIQLSAGLVQSDVAGRAPRTQSENAVWDCAA